MVFKKYDEQQVWQVSCKSGDGELNLKVGDVIAVVPTTGVAKKTNKLSEALAAVATSDLYLIAQSDAVTEKTGTANIKHYDISRDVTLKDSATSIVAAYRITDLNNIDGWEAE